MICASSMNQSSRVLIQSKKANICTLHTHEKATWNGPEREEAITSRLQLEVMKEMPSSRLLDLPSLGPDIAWGDATSSRLR